MLKTRSRRVKLRELALLEKNTRYMTDAMLSQLVENIRRDGCLTNVPLVCETDCQSAFNIDPLSACKFDPPSGTAEVVPVVNRGDLRGFV